MITLVTYDIESDKVRHKVSEACKDYGLTRLQYSVFMGNLHTNLREELEGRLRVTLGSEAGDIRIFPLCDKDVRLAREIVVKGIPRLERRKGTAVDDERLGKTPDERSSDGAEFAEETRTAKRRIGRWEVPKRQDDQLYPFDGD